MARFTRSVLAGLALVALVVGLPFLLVRFGTLPVRQVPTLDQLRDAPGQALTDSAVFAILTVAAWATWAGFTVAVSLELIGAIRGASCPRLPYLTPLQAGARQLVASLLMTATLTGPLASQRVVAAPALPALSQMVRQPVATLVHQEPPPPAPTANPSPATQQPAEDLPVVRVGRGDSPWSLAEHHLGNGLRWREIWDLNRGQPQKDGRAWVIEDQIDIGWQLRLPADATNLPTPPVPGAEVSEEPAREHVVVPGDTLREIAEAELGDPERYPEIVEASRSVEQPNGGRLTDPDLILPGWTLRLPAAGPTTEEPAPSAPAADTPPPNGSGGATTTPPTPSSSTAPPTTETPTTTGAPAPSTSASVTEPPSAPAAVDADTAHSVPDQDAQEGPDAESVLSALGTALAGITGATVLATGLAALIRRHRRLRPARRVPGPPSETELAIVRASDVPLVRWAGQSLAAMAADLDPRRIDGVPVAVELSDQTGIELLWDTPQPDAPSPWQVTAGGWAWRLPYDPDAPVPPDEHPSPLPALVTIGHREGRQLLVNLEALGSLAVSGDDDTARSLVRSMVLELSTSEDLSDSYLTLAGIDADPDTDSDRVDAASLPDALGQLTATERSVNELLDDDATTTFAVRCGHRGTPVDATVMVVDPTSADPDAFNETLGGVVPHHGVALVVLGDTAAARAQLTVSPDGTAHLAPIGLDFQAAGLPSETSDLLRQFLAAEAEDAEDGSTGADGGPSVSPEDLAPPVLFSALPDEEPVSGEMPTMATTGVIDLRIVDHQLSELPPAAVDPRSNGNGHQPDPRSKAENGDLVERPRLLVKVLGRPHVPDRPDLGRRETVLAAYLACHDGPATTSGVQDAIWNGRAVESKTLWNLIARTRRALGSFEDGTPVMPQADRIKGTITLGPGAVSDLTVLRASYERAVESSSTEAIPLLRQALDLIEGPPFDAPGYDWAHHTHQYVAEASALIEQAAELLAKLAQADGDTDLARHALVQGLRALPGNEVLYRRRMHLEADAGNLPGVKAAYEELVRSAAEYEIDLSEATVAAANRWLQRVSP